MNFREIRQFKLSAVGYGVMGLFYGYGACPEHDESIRLFKKAFKCRYNFFDTIERYGWGKMKDLQEKLSKILEIKLLQQQKHFYQENIYLRQTR